MKTSAIASLIMALLALSQSGCGLQEKLYGESRAATHEESHEDAGHHAHKILATSAVIKTVVSTQRYVCQIHSCQHIDVRALEGGYLDEIHVKEGQAVKKGDLMFKILPTLFEAKLATEAAEAQRIQIEFDNAKRLGEKGIVAPQQLALKEAELAKVNARVSLARAELNFTDVKAPFDGIVDRQHFQLGSLIDEGDVLTTFSDNTVMWVYFNVPEARYLEYKADLDKQKEGDAHAELQIELKLANGKVFPQAGKIGAIEADFNNTTGNIAFRADFDNPDSLLRNGQTGTILIHRSLQNVIVIPQRATYEILAKRYVYVIDKDDIVHQRDIKIQSEQDDIFVIEKGLEEGDKIVLEGIRQTRDGDKVEYEFRAPEDVLGNLKYHAE